MSGTHLPPAGERPRTEVYQGSQREARSGTPATVDRARPLEFDRNGFPVAQSSPQRGSDFFARVDRLLSHWAPNGRADTQAGRSSEVFYFEPVASA